MLPPISGTDHAKGIAANRESYGQNPPTIIADGIKPRFLRTMFLVWNDQPVRVFKNPQDRGKIHAVLGQICRFLGWVEFQLHVLNVCHMCSRVNVPSMNAPHARAEKEGAEGGQPSTCNLEGCPPW